MADQEQLQLILQASGSKWNKWRDENRDIVPDLSGADLSGADLIEEDLSRADLRDADLSAANLGRADLSAANLSGANLGESQLRGTYFLNADLSGVQLFEADLNGANLSRAKLCGAHLTDANLTLADCRHANLRGAALSGTSFRWADLSEADLSTAQLEETIFGNSNLTGAKGLSTVIHRGPSTLDHRTLARSGQLPLSFLRGCGLPDTLIEYLPSLLNHSIQFFSCFISYSHEEKPFARRLHDTLQGRGIRCWLDEKQLRAGDDILDHMDRGIRLWDKVLLCCSKHSLTSAWVEAEIDKALEKEQTLRRERQEKVLALIPLDLDGFLFSGWKSGRASVVRQRLALDFQDWDRSHERCEAQIDKLILALRADEREPPPKPLL